MSFDKLTQSARMRFSELRDSTETAHRAIHAVQGNISANERASRNLAGDNADNKARQKPFLDEIARLQGKLPALQANHRALAGLLTHVEMFVGALPGSVAVSDARPVSYEVEDGEADHERVQRVRAKIEELGARRRRAANSFLPVSEMRVAVAEYVKRLVEEGRPNVTYNASGLQITSYPNTPAIALLAWNDPEALKESLNLDVDALVLDMRKRGLIEMSAKARKSAIEKADAEMLALEFEEQFFVRAAAESGQHVVQREKVDPRAVLGIVVQRQAARAVQAAE